MEGLATSKEVAAYLGVHPQSMDRWASQGKGPVYTKIEGIRRYEWEDVRSWIQDNKQRHGPTWKCYTCGEPVRRGGYLIVSIDQAVKYDDAHWGVFHDACEHRAVPNPYEIDIEEADTWPKLADWIAHLWEKEWAHSTNLDALLRKAGARR